MCSILLTISLLFLNAFAVPHSGPTALKTPKALLPRSAFNDENGKEPFFGKEGWGWSPPNPWKPSSTSTTQTPTPTPSEHPHWPPLPPPKPTPTHTTPEWPPHFPPQPPPHTTEPWPTHWPWPPSPPPTTTSSSITKSMTMPPKMNMNPKGAKIDPWVVEHLQGF